MSPGASVPSWDRHAIRAAVHRKGKTLTDLARDAGVFETACREALVRPTRTGERLIAAFLGVPVQELWPERYSSPTRTQTSAVRPLKTSQKAVSDADRRKVA